MSKLNLEHLHSIRKLASRQIASFERRQRYKPLMHLMFTQISTLTTTVIPELTAEPKARTVRASAALEKSLMASSNKEQDDEEERAKILESASRRTQALRAWLESIS